MTNLKKLFSGLAALALVAGFFAVNTATAVHPTWDLTGSYTVNFEYLGSSNPHEITLAQTDTGALSGTGSSGGGAYTYTIDSGQVEGNDFTFTATYTDPVASGTIMIVEGSVDESGALNGNWSDDYGDGEPRTGTFMSTEGTAEPIVEGDSSTIVVTGNSAGGFNQPGWLFARDLNHDTAYEFNENQASIGDGSLYVQPIGATAADKFIAENFLNEPIADVEFISYDFLIAGNGTADDSEQFYLNVYANFGDSPDDKFFDCKYDVVPTTGSTEDFTTVTFDPTQAYPVTTSSSAFGGFTCPAIPADMDDLSAGSTIRAFSINVGDTSASDVGLGGYLDNVEVALTDGITIYDFELNAPTEDGDPVVTNVAFNGTTLTADASDAATGNSNIASASYTVDGGTPVAMTAADGLFDEPTEALTATVAPLTQGSHELCVTATDSAGNISEPVCTTYVQGPVVTVPTNKDQCKNGGYATLTDQNGVVFKNQGQCVSFVNGRR